MSIAGPTLNSPSNAYGDIVDKLVDNASFLWVLRSIAVKQPHYYPGDIQLLEQRLEAQLDGMMTSIEQSWQACLESLEYNEPGEVFTAAVLAFRSKDPIKIQHAVEAGFVNQETEKGLFSALGWLPADLVHSWIKQFLNSKDLDHKYLAIAACSVRRENPGKTLGRILQRDDCRQHTRLYVRALRLIGEIPRGDMEPQLRLAMQSDSEEVNFWSLWSSIMLGDRSAVSKLKPFVLNVGPFQTRAMELCFRALPVDEARAWISELGRINGDVRSVIKASAILGDPHAVNWLISKMSQLDVCQLCGEAFSQITGIELVQNQLVLEEAPPLEGNTDEKIESEDLVLDEDENLPWPDVDKIKTIWTNHGSNFIAGQRYFLGRNISSNLLKDKLISANQRQRQAAAIELALLEPEAPLHNTQSSIRS
ncbi:MAG: TIGR02270 family protein [Gammaproteobacteria bacterium]|nr:TIGR02270 family protein [Gammaproteobacteria bacterium]